MPKKFKPNFSKTAMQCVGKSMLATEGVISKSDFLKYSTSNMLTKLCDTGYFTKVTNEDDLYKSTEQFNKEFRQTYGEIDSHYASSGFSPSRSTKHSSGLMMIQDSIPRDAMVKNQVVIDSGKDLTDEYNDACLTKAYREEVKNYMEEVRESVNSLKAELSYFDNLNSNEMTIEDFHAKTQVEEELAKQERIVDIYENENAFCSPPDVRYTMPVEVFHSQIENLEEVLSGYKETSWDYKHLSDTIDQMQNLYEQVVEREETVVTVSYEIVTNSYSAQEIQQKLNYERITHQDVIMVRV